MIPSVVPDGPVEADAINQLIANVNTSPGVAIFTSNGTWQVPQGVHKFRVSLCGGGGGRGQEQSGIDSSVPGGPGGDSLMRRIWVSDADVGTTYVITVGSAGEGDGVFNGTPGGPSSFGTLLTVGGGGVGFAGSGAGPGAKGFPGQPTGGTLIAQALAIRNFTLFDTPGNFPRAHGEGGAPGIVIIEW